MSDDRPPRRVSAETVRRLAEYAGLPLDAEQYDLLASELQEFIAPLREWDDLSLGFHFEQGRFTYAPSVAQYRPSWRRPTGLNKRRIVVERHGEITLEGADDEDR